MMTELQPLDFLVLNTIVLLGPHGRGNLQAYFASPSPAPINEAIDRLTDAGLARYCYHTYACWPTVAGRQLSSSELAH